MTKLSEKIKTQGDWNLAGDADKMWGETIECIRRFAKEILGVSKRGSGRLKRAWLWNKEVKEKGKAKQAVCKGLVSRGTGEERDSNKVRYKIAKREAKKAITVCL